MKRDDRKSPDWATVSFTEGDRRYFVTIDGSLDGEDTSKEPTLQNAEYVADRETLYVDVGTKTAEGADAGGEMIVELDYHAEFDFCTALPPTVRVIHKTGPPVTVARRNC